MTSGRYDVDDGLWARLRTDFWFWLGVCTLSVSLIPYFVPVLSADQLWAWGWIYADVPAAIVGWAAVAVGVATLAPGPERTFWSLVAFGYGTTVGIEVANAFIPDSRWDATVGLVLDSAYMVYYAALILAATASGSLAQGRGVSHLHRLRMLGLAILGTTYLIYFQAVPSHPHFDDGSWYPGLMLYAALDFVVCLLLVRAARETDQPRWRGILLGLAVLNGTYGILDGWEAALYLEPWASIELRPQWDLFWYLPDFFFLVYARGYLTRPDRAITRLPADPERRPDRGLMMTGLVALPLLHSLLYFLGVLDEQYRETREGVLVAFLVAMGATLWVYFRALERERARSTRAALIGEERYRTFLRRRVDGMYRAEASPPIPTSLPLEEQILRFRGRMRIAEVTDPDALLPSGDPAEMAVGRPLVDLFGDSDPDARLREWADSGYRSEFEVSRDGASAGLEDVRYTLTGILEDGAVARAWLTRTDLTPERHALAETERLERELERARKLESIGTLAGGIAHDFNNLLLPIIGYTELARSRIGEDDDDARESLGHVLGASERAAELVRQILSVSRTQPGTERPVLVQRVVEDALKLLRPGLPGTIEIESDLDDCPPVLGDSGRIHQVVMNVCTNAAQAMESGRGRLRVTLRHEPVNEEDAPLGWMKLVVTDDGTGIAATSLDRIFEPFYTTKEPGSGTGLGLSVVHGIVASHNGRIEVESQPGAGSAFTIRLPISDRGGTPPPSAPRTGTETLRVLVVDDRVDVAAVTHRLLESRGHAVVSVTDPAEARRVLDESRDGWDVLVTDYNMKGTTGYELMADLRALAPGLGVVVSSGHGTTYGYRQDDHVRIQKPFSADELSAAVQQAYHQAHQQAGPPAG